jgi:DHA2 family multidrug resistance protein-like MFS transporter
MLVSGGANSASTCDDRSNMPMLNVSEPTSSQDGALDGLEVPRRYWSAVTIWCALVLSVLDSVIANIALPTIARDLSLPAADVVWVINAYQFAIVVALLPLGTLGDMLGHRRIFLTGLALFTIASLGSSCAPGLTSLVIARAIQGLGAACIMAQNGALVRFTYPSRMLGRGMGFNALVISAAATLGPSVASIILSVASWHWLFAVNIPIGILAFLVGRKSLPENQRTGSFDFTGTILSVVMFGFGFVGIDLLARPIARFLGPLCVAVAIIAFVALVRRSQRMPSPIIPLDLLKNKQVAMAIGASIAAFSAQMLAFVTLPFFLESVLHLDQVVTGLLMTSWFAAVGFIAPLAGRLADKLPAAILSGAGLLILAFGLVLLAFLRPGASDISVIWRMSICGLGFGLFQSPNNRMLISSAPKARSGAAGSLMAMARIAGQTTGAILASTFLRFHNFEVFAFASAASLSTFAAFACFLRMEASKLVDDR